MCRFHLYRKTILVMVFTLTLLLMLGSFPVYAEDVPASDSSVNDGMELNPEPIDLPPTNFSAEGNGDLLNAPRLMSMSVMSSTAAEIQHTLRPTESATDLVYVDIPPVPPSADVVFAFDLTGSMGPILNTAKANAVNIMNQLSALGCNVNYGVISYMDYPAAYSNYYGYSSTYGKPPEYAYRMDQAVTADISAVAASINTLTLGNGWDLPEAYTRMMYESYSDSNIDWRPGAKHIVISFGDSIPHDNNINEGVTSGTFSTGGDPGRDGLAMTADDLDLQTVLAEMAANGITLLECHSAKTATYNNHWTYWTGLTGGAMYITSSDTLVSNVVTAVQNSLREPYIEDLHLVPSDYASWVSTDPAAYPSVPTGTTVPFNVTFTVPAGTSAGVYKLVLSALDKNGVNYGDTNVTITVPEDDLPPAADISYDITSLTNKSVVASLVNPSEPITVTNNGGSTQCTFAQNGTFTFEFVDATGNTGTATATVTWIDKVPPAAELSYSTSSPTNQPVKVSLVNLSEPITVTNNGGSTEYTFNDNGSFTFEFVDTAGNTGTATANVAWIDKTAPTAQISYSTTDPTCGDVTSTLVPSEPVTVTNNGGSGTYTFSENGSFTFEFVDAAGNTGTATASVDWIFSGKGIIKVDMGLYNGCKKKAEVHLDAGKQCGSKFYNQGNLNYDEIACKGIELRSCHLLTYG
ncbi:MAG: hypothetical protein ACM3PP_02295, partial [Candidatus Saccharibacteria bacterium]